MVLLDQSGLRQKGVDYSPQHIRRLVSAGIFPPPVKMGQGRNAKNMWIGEEIDTYIAAKIKERNEALAAARRAA